MTESYFDQMREADELLDEALAHIRAEEDAQRLGPVEAAAERCELLERHITECRRLRAEIGVAIPPLSGGFTP